MARGRFTCGAALELRFHPGEEGVLLPGLFVFALPLKQALFHALHVARRKGAGLLFLEIQRLAPEGVEDPGQSERLIAGNDKPGQFLPGEDGSRVRFQQFPQFLEVYRPGVLPYGLAQLGEASFAVCGGLVEWQRCATIKKNTVPGYGLFFVAFPEEFQAAFS